jgi:hypothetical protein
MLCCGPFDQLWLTTDEIEMAGQIGPPFLCVLWGQALNARRRSRSRLGRPFPFSMW